MVNRVLGLLVAGLFFTSVAHASVIIDDYVTAQTVTDGSGEVVGAGIIGTAREITTAAFGGGSTTVQINGGGSAFQFTIGGTGGNATLLWDGVGTGDLNADLSAENAFVLHGISNAGIINNITVTVKDGSGGEASVSPAAVNGDIVVSFASFAGVDFSDVKSIALSFTTSPGIFESTGVWAVPEPSTFALLGLGLLAPAMVMHRRQRKTRKAAA